MTVNPCRKILENLGMNSHVRYRTVEQLTVRESGRSWNAKVDEFGKSKFDGPKRVQIEQSWGTKSDQSQTPEFGAP